MSMGKNDLEDLEKSSNDNTDEPTTYSTHKFTKRLLSWGVESRGTFFSMHLCYIQNQTDFLDVGISPVPVEERTDTQYYKLFFIWFTMNFNILSFSAGTLGPVAYGLGIRESCLVIFFFNLLCCLPTAYLWVTRCWRMSTHCQSISTAQHGVQSWVYDKWYKQGSVSGELYLLELIGSYTSLRRYYGVILPCILNLVNMFGFCTLNAILGGQTLASVADGNLTWKWVSPNSRAISRVGRCWPSCYSQCWDCHCCYHLTFRKICLLVIDSALNAAS